MLSVSLFYARDYAAPSLLLDSLNSNHTTTGRPLSDLSLPAFTLLSPLKPLAAPPEMPSRNRVSDSPTLVHTTNRAVSLTGSDQTSETEIGAADSSVRSKRFCRV